MLIRDIDTLSEMLIVEELQKEIWGVEDREILPALEMIPVKKVGGLLLGAFDDEQMIGFAFAFPGFEEGRPFLHSDMVAVKSTYRSHGIGYQLKLAQRVQALQKGIDKITWTFDPLQSLNARLNFGKLGGISDRYYINFYGETTSPLHSTGTDRLWVTWNLNSENVKERIAGNKQVNSEMNGLPSLVTINEKQEPVEERLKVDSVVCIDIPANINELVKSEPEIGKGWRNATRKAFTHAFADGFVVEDLHLIEDQQQRFGRYVLRR
jgi:predicted GNAT superfamily acetyltransferase